MAPDTTENWWTVGQIVGAVLGGIAVTFFAIYRKANEQRSSDDKIVSRSVGAAFVDKGAAADLASIAEDTKALRKMAEGRETRFHEDDLLKKVEERLRKKQEEE